jgi:hypothetical protein
MFGWFTNPYVYLTSVSAFLDSASRSSVVDAIRVDVAGAVSRGYGELAGQRGCATINCQERQDRGET